MSSGASSYNEKQQKHCCLCHEFLKSAARNPNKTAVVHATPLPGGGVNQLNNRGAASYSTPPKSYDGDESFTFSDILKSVNDLSARLRSTLDGADDTHHLITPQSSSSSSSSRYKPKILGIYIPPSVDYVISVLAILRFGEAFLPLDPSWPRDRVISIISSSNVDLVITSESSFIKAGYDFNEFNLSNWLAESGITCPILFYSMEDCLSVMPMQLPWPCEMEKKRLFCYLMYTSGSTGKPKGVCGTEEGLLNRFMWMQELYPLHGDEVLLFKTSISFIDHLQEFLGAMLTGCTLVIPPFNQLKKDPFSVVRFLQAYPINRLTAVPSLIRAILPALQSQHNMQIQSSLKLLVLSGEVFPLSLWDVLSKSLPRTAILNLYGTTEVSADCTYFDCKRLPKILETESLKSVPIGVRISNCDVVLVSKTATPNQGEICVGGSCLCTGYSSKFAVIPFESVKLHKNLICNCLMDNCGSQVYYRTGDFAQRLQSGDLVFLGRTDRTVKVNGHRIALEEVENTIRQHPYVADAAVIAREGPEELTNLDAVLVLKENEKSGDLARSSIRRWMVEKVPLAMIPHHFIFAESLPISSSGKIDYVLLETSAFSSIHFRDKNQNSETKDLMNIIKKAFCDALMVEEVSGDDDFFDMGGSSISAAQASYNLGTDMRLLYEFRTPLKLYNALLDKMESYKRDVATEISLKSDTEDYGGNMSYPANSAAPNNSVKSKEWLPKNLHEMNYHNGAASKRFKVDLDKCIPKCGSSSEGYPWSALIPFSCSFSRCNKVIYQENYRLSNTHQITWSEEVLRNGKGCSMQELWKVCMESCVDASPLVVYKDQDIYLFIGSHAHKFICVSAKSGSVRWEVKVQGRIECSAAIVADFSQVVVGCYEGTIYFLDFMNGNICWTFQTCAEVKCQPVVDKCRHVIWCGSHDHYLYALDYRNCCCIYKLSCGGSIFGSPAIDEGHDILYVASTSGRVTSLSVKISPFHTLWQRELEVPIFGSLSIGSPHANVICCLVDGNIVALDLAGSTIWRYKTGGPVFAGACISCVLPSQVLVCSRNGSVYSFEVEKGHLLWEYNIGDPITSSAYVDEHLQLVSASSHVPNRLVCICSSSGTVHLLNVDVVGKQTESSKSEVQEIARLELPGDVFSSPVMIGGRIFVGCRDDYVHCISSEIKSLVQK